jgi:hypothetical protein
MSERLIEGEIAKIVCWECEGIEPPYGWASLDKAQEGRARLKGKKKIRPETDALVIERVETAAKNLMEEDLGKGIYYWCVTDSGRLLVDSRFLKAL